MTPARPTLILASRSPRRARLLEAAGFEFEIRPPPLDDADLSMPSGVDPPKWVAGLAHLKAASLGLRPAQDHLVVLGADTVVVKEGKVIGQPRSKDHARSILERLEGGAHQVLSGVAILAPRQRMVFVDSAVVTVGAIGSDRIDHYLESGDWRGKAGAYNLIERQQDGWPITHQGEPSTIMGLPIPRLIPILARVGIVQAGAPSIPPTQIDPA